MTDKTRVLRDKVMFRTVKDLYLFYRYKYYDSSSSTVPVPYFPKKDISTHEYKLTYKQWKSVVKVYFEVAIESMLTGDEFKIPFTMGRLYLAKIKMPASFMPSSDIPFSKHISKYLDGYAIKLRWDKTFRKNKPGRVMFKNKSMFSVYVPKSTYFKKILHKIYEDRSILYRLITIYPEKKNRRK